MAWVAAAATVGSALINRSASRSAASQQADAAQRASEEAAAVRAQTRADLQPWRTSGETANNKLAALMGLGGEDQTAQLQSTPGYQFRLKEGMQGVENSAASRGGLFSGGTLKALQRYGQDFASGEYQNQFNRLNSMSGAGQSAAAGQGTANQAFGAQQQANTIGAGNAMAAGTVGQANALTSGIGQGVNMYQQNKMMDWLKPKDGFQGNGMLTSYGN